MAVIDSVRVERTCHHPIYVDPKLYTQAQDHFEGYIRGHCPSAGVGLARTINRLVLRGVTEHLRPHLDLGKRRPRVVSDERAWLTWDPKVWRLLDSERIDNYWATHLRHEPGFEKCQGPSQWVNDLLRWHLDTLIADIEHQWPTLPGIPRARPVWHAVTND